ncbi:hypothetical protein SPI_02629 [Niveomyces insectorum RCEF 264]|uniref:Uncharacterized protein n=1 Tax=Niveomyces insectorum RCEF 264 TaxID=1081102 RepID=A0A162J9Y5_9HYPO|nr:hypothetical protein SPI_02629 [Niveomyces insectorum RCEF 264]
MPVVIPAAQPPDSTAVSSAPEKQQGALTAHPYYYWLLLAAAVVGIANLGLVAISPSFANRAGFLRKREKATTTDQKLDFSDPDEQDQNQKTYSDPTAADPSPFSVRLATAAAHGTLSRGVSSRSSGSHNNNHNNSDNDGDGDDTIAMPDDEARRSARGSAADTHDGHRHNEMPKKRGVVDAGAASPQPASSSISSSSSSSSSTTLLLAVGPGTAPDRPSLAGPAHVAFMHQPNPDYTTDTAPVDAAHGSFSSSSAASLGAAAPQHSDAGATPRTSLPVFSSPGASSAASSETTVTTQSCDSSASPYAFSYPPAPGPGLPSSPLAAAEEDDEDGTAAEAATAAVVPPFDAAEIARGVGIRGDVISLLDDDGAVWRRHTRVYGGGVCLACLEAESRGGGRGSYGDSVPLEERLF